MKHIQANPDEKCPQEAETAPVKVFYYDGKGNDAPKGWYWWLYENTHENAKPIGPPNGPFKSDREALDGYLKTLNEAN